MNCLTDQDLNAFIDRELSPVQMADIDRHIAECGACRDRVAQYRQMGETIRAAKLAVPSLAAQSRWMDAVAISSDRSVRRLAGWMTVAASVILAATLTISFSTTAQATPTFSDWEATAIAGPDSAGDSPRATAQLIAFDLSLPASNGAAR